jgi:hypothetical protein
MTTTYEWDIETWNGEEIVDHNHRDRLADFGMEELIQAINCDFLNEARDFTKLVLVRDSDRDGRAWAYITHDGKLPEEMVDAYERPVCKVPKRFIEEFAR